MKRKEISISTTLKILMTSSVFLFCTALTAQEKKTVTPEEEKVPLYQGTTVGLDVLGIGSNVLGGDATSAEVQVEVNLKNRYIPVVEIGYASYDATDDETDIHYETSAPYFRIGMNYNFLFKKPYLPGFLYGGIRIGYTSFSYDVSAPDMVSANWAYPTIAYSYDGVKGNVSWMEFLCGIKVKIYNRFYMGWSLRYRVLLSSKKAENSEPWYIPGYGTNNSTKFGATYSLIYELPF